MVHIEEASAEIESYLQPISLVKKAAIADSQPDLACELCLQASVLFIAAVHGEAN